MKIEKRARTALGCSGARGMISRNWVALAGTRKENKMYAALGSDGLRMVVWGIGRTEAAAEKEAREEARQSDVDPELTHTVKITAAQTRQIKLGHVGAESLGLAVAGRGLRARRV